MATLRQQLIDRASILSGIRNFFETRGYLEVETPSLVRSPGLDLHLDAFAIEGNLDGHPAYLSTSPEYHMKRLLAAGLERIFQLARCYRRGEIGTKHNPEFCLLEWYQAGMDYHQLMDETEALVCHVATQFRGRPQLIVNGRPMDLQPPFERITVCELFKRYAALSYPETLRLAEHEPETFFFLLVDRIDPALRSEHRPLFVHDFPTPMASLARRKADAPHLCERFELYLGDLELCNGFGELTCPKEQRQRLKHDQQLRLNQGKAVYPIDERFLAALAKMPDASGNALGVDRLVAACRGCDSLAGSIAFPVACL